MIVARKANKLKGHSNVRYFCLLTWWQVWRKDVRNESFSACIYRNGYKPELFTFTLVKVFLIFIFLVYAEKLHMPGDHVFLVYSVEVSDVIQQGKVQSGIKLTTGTVSSVTWSCCHVYISRVVWCLVVWLFYR